MEFWPSSQSSSRSGPDAPSSGPGAGAPADWSPQARAHYRPPPRSSLPRPGPVTGPALARPVEAVGRDRGSIFVGVRSVEGGEGNRARIADGPRLGEVGDDAQEPRPQRRAAFEA